MKQYLFQSPRLGFRNWFDADLPSLSALNADPAVMQFFPSTTTPAQTEDFMQRMQASYAEKGYCYFAVDRLEDQQFIGFIGLFDQAYEAEFTPCVDIGWRLDKAYWQHGYAAEGAKRCLEYAFQELGFDRIVSVAPCINLPSIHVMEKIGMYKRLEFKHPKLAGDKRLEHCVCYEIHKSK